MKWIRNATRVAIYQRDGLACGYCGQGIEDGAQLTLDHCTPRSKGGSNEPSNLITCCHDCNSRRGDMPMSRFAKVIASEFGRTVTGRTIAKHIQACRKRKLDRKAARIIVRNRNVEIQELLASSI
jgi:hypothetical protein